VSLFLLLLVTVGNLALGFGLAVHLGFGPDFARVAAWWDEFRAALSHKWSRTKSSPSDPSVNAH
jgi:hypothetical protein